MSDTGELHEPPVAGVLEQDGAIVIALSGELDLYNAHVIRAALFAAAEQAPSRVIVDLGAVTFIDSTALGVLVEARLRVANRRAFLLAAPRAETRRALEISGLDRHFGVHDSIAGALAAEV